jgi:hypothetical protein
MNKRFSLATAASLTLSAGPFSNDRNYSQLNFVTSGVSHISIPRHVNPRVISGTSGSTWWVSDNGTGPSALDWGSGPTLRN